jgi:lipoprotein-releasing system ATP-binding protein
MKPERLRQVSRRHADDGVAGPPTDTVLACTGLTRSFEQGGARIDVLHGLNLRVHRGERVAVVGASGSGKTTLLQLLGALDRPSAGTVHVAGRDVAMMSERERGRWRNAHIGFVYQFHHLLPEFSAVENVAMPLLIRRVNAREATERAAALLARVGLEERLQHKPAAMSGGERQRAAVARALITNPGVVLADEPTGNLDRPTGRRVFELMLELNAQLGTALVVVTHDPEIAAAMERVLSLDEAGLHELPAGAAGTLAPASMPDITSTPD